MRRAHAVSATRYMVRIGERHARGDAWTRDGERWRRQRGRRRRAWWTRDRARSVDQLLSLIVDEHSYVVDRVETHWDAGRFVVGRHRASTVELSVRDELEAVAEARRRRPAAPRACSSSRRPCPASSCALLVAPRRARGRRPGSAGARGHEDAERAGRDAATGVVQEILVEPRARWWRPAPLLAQGDPGGAVRRSEDERGARALARRRSLAPARRRPPRRAPRARFETPSGRRSAGRSTAPTICADFDPGAELGLPGRAALHARRPAHHVPRPPVDHAPVRRLRHRPRRPTRATATCWSRGRPASRWPSTCPRRWATTPTTRWPRARWAGWAWPSTPSRTWSACFDGIPLDRCQHLHDHQRPGRACCCSCYVAVAERAGRRRRRRLRGTIQNDILKEYIARGTYIFPPGPRLRLITDIFAWCARAHAAAGTPSPSAATTSARRAARPCRSWPSPSPTRIAYVRGGRWSAGLDVDDFAPRLSFFFNVHNNFLEEVAKFRAARRLWARIMRERFGGRDPELMMLRFHTQTAGSHAHRPAAAQQRGAGDAAGPGRGAGRHPVACTPTASTRPWPCPPRTARAWPCAPSRSSPTRAAAADSVDPLGGSYLVERWTRDLEEEAWALIDEVEALGGAAAGHRGRLSEAAGSARPPTATQRAIEAGEQECRGREQLRGGGRRPRPASSSPGSRTWKGQQVRAPGPLPRGARRRGHDRGPGAPGRGAPRGTAPLMPLLKAPSRPVPPWARPATRAARASSAATVPAR